MPTGLPTGRIGLPSGAERGHRRFARGSVLVTTVFVDGNNVMGSRADGWWRNRAEATQRLVAEIAPVALSHAGAWTIVFDGPRPPDVALSQECLNVVHTGHGRRDGADDRIVELVGTIPDPATALVYTSDAGRRARVHALGARVAGARALLEEIAAVATRRNRPRAAACSSRGEGAARSSYTPFRACPRILETPRLWLRPPTRADLAHVQRYATREAFYRYLDMDVPTPGSVERYLVSVIAAWEDPKATVRVFAIEPKEAGRIGGLIRIAVDDDASGSGTSGTVSTTTSGVAATRPKRSRRWCGSDSRRWDLSGSGRPWTPGTRSPGRCSSGQALGERNGCPATGSSGVLRAIRTFTR